MNERDIAAGLMPDLTLIPLHELGDVTGITTQLNELVGRYDLSWVASDSAPTGTVAVQDPPPGTPLDGVTQWSLEISDGGPLVLFEDLPDDVAAFTESLPGFSKSEPLIKRGDSYKSDAWLFGLNCGDVQSHYRTFSDARYDTACPGDIQIVPDGFEEGR